MKENSIHIHHGLQLMQLGEMGEGYIATSFIEKGTVLMKIASDKFLTYDRLFYFEDFSCIAFVAENKIVQFAFYLAYIEKIPKLPQNHQKMLNSYFEQQIQYLKGLPKSFNNLICWKDEELSLLADENLIKKTHKKKRIIKNEYEKIISFLKNRLSNQTQNRPFPIFHSDKDLDSISLEDVVRFYAAIESRNVYYGTLHDPGSEMGALIPFLEKFNHCKEASCVVCQSSDQYIVKAKRNLQPNEQLFVTYGDFKYDWFLEAHGFIPLQNRHLMTMTDEASIRKNLAISYNRALKQ